MAWRIPWPAASSRSMARSKGTDQKVHPRVPREPTRFLTAGSSRQISETVALNAPGQRVADIRCGRTSRTHRCGASRGLSTASKERPRQAKRRPRASQDLQQVMPQPGALHRHRRFHLCRRRLARERFGNGHSSSRFIRPARDFRRKQEHTGYDLTHSADVAHACKAQNDTQVQEIRRVLREVFAP